jgi:hypothetical protein
LPRGKYSAKQKGKGTGEQPVLTLPPTEEHLDISALETWLDVKGFNERQQGRRTPDDDRLAALVEVISRHWHRNHPPHLWQRGLLHGVL